MSEEAPAPAAAPAPAVPQGGGPLSVLDGPLTQKTLLLYLFLAGSGGGWIWHDKATADIETRIEKRLEAQTKEFEKLVEKRVDTAMRIHALRPHQHSVDRRELGADLQGLRARLDQINARLNALDKLDERVRSIEARWLDIKHRLQKLEEADK